MPQTRVRKTNLVRVFYRVESVVSASQSLKLMAMVYLSPAAFTFKLKTSPVSRF